MQSTDVKLKHESYKLSYRLTILPDGNVGVFVPALGYAREDYDGYNGFVIKWEDDPLDMHDKVCESLRYHLTSMTKRERENVQAANIGMMAYRYAEMNCDTVKPKKRNPGHMMTAVVILK